MTAIGLLMPIVAAGSLTVALLVPLRDARRGERATLRGRTPVRSSFGPVDAIEPRSTTLGHLARVYRAIGERVAAVLCLRPRSAPSTRPRDDGVEAGAEIKSDESFADRIESLISDHSQTEATPTTIENVVISPMKGAANDRHTYMEADEREGGVTNDAGDSEPEPIEPVRPGLVATLSDPQHARKFDSVTRLGRDLPPPLTRLRLRPAGGVISWPMHLPIPHLGTSDRERRDMLADLERVADSSHERALSNAYREEDATGRSMALRALARISTDGSRAILADALNLGTDEERVLAVDLLAANDEREALVPALHDRLDAIAARAALAYVRSNHRSDYQRVLSSHVDEGRLATILALLGGILE